MNLVSAGASMHLLVDARRDRHVVGLGQLPQDGHDLQGRLVGAPDDLGETRSVRPAAAQGQGSQAASRAAETVPAPCRGICLNTHAQLSRHGRPTEDLEVTTHLKLSTSSDTASSGFRASSTKSETCSSASQHV